MQYPQPLQTSSCTTTVPNSVRNSAPVGQTSRQAARVQCLQTSELISQRSPPCPLPDCSTKATWRQRSAPSPPELSYDVPAKPNDAWGTPFHSLQATSQALQPMQIDVSVKNPAWVMAGLLGHRSRRTPAAAGH